ncbi:MAG TPA: RHS repeat-associated core domain-containing protein [Candidatus Angelobacter sp.]|nr:RHS repeat-associated core domain-containing protein [Candidatus Angelobacter sp.]
MNTVGAWGQVQPNLKNGFEPYGSHGGSNLDTVNHMNGNWMLHVPLLPDIGQRGNRGSHYFLSANSKNWQVSCVPDSSAATGQNCYWIAGGTGVVLDHSNDLRIHRTLNIFNSGNGTVSYEGSGYTVLTPDGSSHEMYGLPNTVDANLDATVYESVDTTGYRLVLGGQDSNGVWITATLLDRQGNQYGGSFPTAYAACSGSRPDRNQLPQPGNIAPIIDDAPIGDRYCSQTAYLYQVTDSNGNRMSYQGPQNPNAGVDTVGRGQPLEAGATAPDFTGCLSRLPITHAYLYYYPGPNGTTQQVKTCYSAFPFQTAFHTTAGNTGVAEAQTYNGNYNSVLNGYVREQLVTVVLADGSKWTFDYDSYLEVSSVGLPTGGSINLTWTTISFANCNLTDPTPVSRAVATRTVTDNNGHSSIWTYNWGTPSSGSLVNSETDPMSNDTVHTFTALDPNGGGRCGFYETRAQSYQGTGSSRQLLKQVDTTYTSLMFTVATSQASTLGNVVPTSIKTTIYPSGKVSLISKTYDSGLGTNAPLFGNVLAEKVYDWGQGAPGALLREIDTSYLWQTDARYLNAHLLDLPGSVVTKDGTGNRVAETDYTYDESQYLTASNITTQHGATSSAVRGNLTSMSRWLNPGNSTVSSHTNWYDTGEVYQQIDPLGNTTIHAYDSFHAGAYSTKTQDTLGYIVSGTYDFNTGLLTSFTNANATTQASGNIPGDAAHTTNYVYDFMGRMTSATFPADPSGNHPQTTFNYPDLTTVEHLHKITSSLIDDGFTYFDRLGRAIRAKHVLPGGNNALVDTTYDGLDRVASVANPYFSTSELTYGVTQSQYDALGRSVQTTSQDGSISSISYSDNCTTTTDEAGKQRRACTDGLGRLIEVDEPGDNFPGSQSSGSLMINGNLQSKSGVGAVGATKGSASITISGSNQFIPGDHPPCDPCNPPLYDSGKIYVTVNGHEYDLFYGSGGNAPDSAASVAQGLVNAIQADAARIVNASVPTNGTTITLTAVNAGTAGNCSFSSGSVYDNVNFSHASFTTNPTSGNLTGGTDSNPGTTVYDSGTLTMSVGSFNATVNYGLSGNSTAQQVASAVASALSGANSPVTAIASGSNIKITYKTIGTAGDLAVLVNSASSQSQYFSSPSFTSAGGALTGGFDPQGPSLDHAYYVTLYFYDALGNLLCVEQHGNVDGAGCSSPPSAAASSPWRVRRFTYDSLSRLFTAKNPESGLISHTYDAAGNLLQKTSPAANQPVGSTQTTAFSYCYDALNRLTAKGYSAQSCPLASPVVTYTYDQRPNGIGRLTSLTDQAGSATYNYDILGRMASESRTINGLTKTMSYTYNLDGSIATMTYPSATPGGPPGDVITYTPDSAGRMLSAVDTTNSSNPINYVTGATYNAAGSLTGSVYGQSSSFSGITNTFVYTNRLQPCRMMASTSGAVSPNCDASWGNVLDLRYDFHQGNGNNGNVYSVTNYRDQSRNQTFAYDALNRLISAQNAGTDCSKKLLGGHTEYWGNSYSYDAWGNLLEKKVTKCQAENLSAGPDANNHLQGYTYDAAGDLLQDNNGTNYVYDAENRISSTSGFSYVYDADGNRVQKTNGNTTPATGTLYWYMSSGIVGESDLLGTLQSEYVFFDGERIARKDFPGNAVSYYFSDHLKTASVISDATGSNIKSESDYYPWGGELQFANGDSNHYKFTGKERDAETGLDYFGARHYSNGLGRFITPDWAATPVAVPYADLTDPQSLNQYTYVRNLPTTRIDTDGHDGWDMVKAVVTVGAIATSAYIRSENQRTADNLRAFGKVFVHFMTSGPPPHPPVPGPSVNPCLCLPQTNSKNSDSNRNQNNSSQQSKSQLPQDKNVNPKPPAANDGKGTVGPNANQNAQAQVDAAAARANGSTDIRINQQQVNANGERVGINRPDLQHTDSNGVRQNVEYETGTNGRGDAHTERIQTNDPNAKTTVKIIK